ncbi:MAG: hypothetical protein ACE5ID_05935 [Acidobacteriota bacterium]
MTIHPAAKRVLFYSPYGKWHYHRVQEATLAHALKQRGAAVRFVACDGLFPACDVYREGLNPRGPVSCLECQHVSTGVQLAMGLEAQWLGRHLPAGAAAAVHDWVQSLPAEELLAASWRGYPVGAWARSSAFFQYRMSRFDLENSSAIQGVRDHVHGTALATEALLPLYDEFRPDVVVLLNGRFFSHWAALELARERGIKVVTHERGLVAGSLRFLENRRVHDLHAYDSLWENWRDHPLNTEELTYTHNLLQDRRAGRNLPWTPFSPAPECEEGLRRRLHLGERPVIAVFSSSDDETAAFPEWRVGAFPDSLAWLPATLKLAHRLPDHVLVLRMHPNLTAGGVNSQAMEEVRAMSRCLPGNCRIVMPEENVSSYTLADMARVGVVYYSTLGLEMACRGQPVVAVCRGWYGRCDFVTGVESPRAYLPALLAAVQRRPSLATARAAYRFVFHCYHDLSIPFPLVVEQPRHTGKVTYGNTADLIPGKEDNLDRICRFILTGEPLASSPSEAHQARTQEEEDLFFARWYPRLVVALETMAHA